MFKGNYPKVRKVGVQLPRSGLVLVPISAGQQIHSYDSNEPESGHESEQIASPTV